MGGMVPGRFEQGPFAWSPLTTFHRIFDDFDRLFEDMQRGGFGRGVLSAMRSPIEAILAPISMPDVGEVAAWTPRIEVRDAGNEYVVSAEIPGVDPKDVQIEVTDEGLIIRGEVRQEQTQDEGGIRRTERRYGSFFRQIALPPGLVDADKAQAEVRNGVLTVRLPKTEAARQRVRRIQIVGAEPIGGRQEAAGSGQQGAAGGQAEGEGRRRSA